MPKAKTEKTETRYPVLKPIRYHNPDSPLYKKVLKPGDPELENGLAFPHLNADGIKLLQRKRVLGPAIQQ